MDSSIRRVIGSAAIGNFVEWYDFTSYAAAASVMATQFFPAHNRTAGLIGAYAILGITYITRPLGSLVAGWIGDVLGRKSALSLTILIMGGATAIIGLLPTYGQIGIAAPIALTICRLVQGIGTGGEFGSATTFVYEHADRSRRARYVSYLVAVMFCGLTASVLLASCISATIGDAAFAEWGWRILFLVAAPLAAVGVYVRRRTDETPAFQAIQRDREKSGRDATPLSSAFRQQWRRMLMFVLIVSGFTLLTPIQSSFYLSYLRGPGGLSTSTVYALTLVADVVLIGSSLIAGQVIARWGIRPVLILGGLSITCFSVPVFLLGLHGAAAATIGSAIFAAIKGSVAVASSIALPQLFPASIRVTAGGFAYNTSTVLFAAAGPTFGVWINATTGTPMAFSAFLALAGLISAISATTGRKLFRDGPAELAVKGTEPAASGH